MSISGKGAKLKSYKTLKVIDGKSEVYELPRNCFVAAVCVPESINGTMTVLGSFTGEPRQIFAEGELLEPMAALPGSVIVLYPDVMKPLRFVRFDFAGQSENDPPINGELEISLLVV